MAQPQRLSFGIKTTQYIPYAEIMRIWQEAEDYPAIEHAWLFDHLFAPWASPINASLVYALAYLALWLGLMWLLDRRGIRLTV